MKLTRKHKKKRNDRQRYMDRQKGKLKEYFSIFCLRKTPIVTYETSFKRSNFLKLNFIIVVFLQRDRQS